MARWNRQPPAAVAVTVAETLKVPEWSPADIQMEIDDYLMRLQLRAGEQRLIRLEDL